MGEVISKPHTLWAEVLRRRVRKSRPDLLEWLDRIFKFVPSPLRRGPWSWAPTISLASLMLASGAILPYALSQYEPYPAAESLRARRASAFLYGASVLGYMGTKYGMYPMASWTMLGWTLATLRYLAGAIGLLHLQRVLTFPSLLANFVTFLVWYSAIIPGIAFLMPKHHRGRLLRDMVFSLFMFTVHGINLPFSLADFAWQPIQLNAFDLWSGSIYGLVYITFYLLLLDPVGAHLYYILSPRKWWGAVVHVAIFSLGLGIFKYCNRFKGEESFGPDVSRSGHIEVA